MVMTRVAIADGSFINGACRGTRRFRASGSNASRSWSGEESMSMKASFQCLLWRHSDICHNSRMSDGIRPESLIPKWLRESHFDLRPHHHAHE